MAINLSVNQLTLQDVTAESNAVQLGNGAYGKVLEVEYIGTSFTAQVFQVDDSLSETETIKRSLLQQCLMWSVARHPNVAQFIGVWYRNGDKSFPAIVTEKMRYSLRSLMESRGENNDASKMNIHQKMLILQDVSKGLWYLHSQKPAIVHGGLTPDNIVLGCTQCSECSCMKAKITNVGVAKVMKTDNYSESYFLPPEATNDNPQYASSYDTFCFGKIFWYTVANQKFPAECEKLNTIEFQIQKYLNKPVVGDCTNLKSLLKSCESEIPDERPPIARMSEAIKHVIYKDVDTVEVNQLN